MVDNFFYLRSFRGSIILFKLSNFEIYFFLNFSMISVVDMVYSRVIVFKKIYSFIVYNSFLSKIV
jgi:hypothetical protein